MRNEDAAGQITAKPEKVCPVQDHSRSPLLEVASTRRLRFRVTASLVLL
jgi:hypothetical protein